MKKRLDTVTLLGIDGLDIDRLALAAQICQEHFEFADVKLLTSLPAKGHANVVPIAPITTIEEYSRFAIAELDKYVDTPHVLIIQYDGFILNPDAWQDEFLDYDYIGAPWLVSDWSVREFNFPPHLLGQHVVGNGGFCIRSKKLLTTLAEMARASEFDTYHPEDVVLCVGKRAELESRGIKFAPASLADQFSFEAKGGDNYKWDGQFGFHGLKWTDISKWLVKHPEYPIKNELSRNRPVPSVTSDSMAQ